MAGWFAPRIFAIDRPDAGIHACFRVGPRLGLEVAGLEDRVRLVVAVAGIDRADDRELVEHRRLLGQVLAEERPGSRVGMTPNGPRFSSGRSGFGSQVSIWLGPPVIQSRMTLLRPASGRPASAARARSRSSAGRLNPAIPAIPALSMLRRLTTASPSRSRALRPPKACWWLCGCRSVVPMSSSRSGGLRSRVGPIETRTNTGRRGSRVTARPA